MAPATKTSSAPRRHQVVAAEELRYRRRGGIGEDRFRRVVLRDRAVDQHRHPRPHGDRFLLVAGDVDEGAADFVVDAAELDHHTIAEVRIERAERLVEQEQRGSRDQRAGERDPLLLAARDLADLSAAEAGEADQRQDRVDATRDVAPVGVGSARLARPKATLSKTLRCGKSAKS